MAKLTLADVTNISGAESTAIATLNSNNDLLEAALENTLSRDGTTPNTMGADLDMNSNDILNVNELTSNSVNTTTLVVDGTNLSTVVADAEAAVTSAEAAQAAAESAASLAEGYVEGVKTLTFQSKALAAAADINSDVKTIQTEYYAPTYSDPRTLWGGGKYVRVDGRVLFGYQYPASSYIRSVDRYMPDGTVDANWGGYWLLDENNPFVEMFGGLPEPTDCTTPIRDGIAYLRLRGVDATGKIGGGGVVRFRSYRYRTTEEIQLRRRTGLEGTSLGEGVFLSDETVFGTAINYLGAVSSSTSMFRTGQYSNNNIYTLNYNSETAPFTVDQTLTGGTTGGTAVIIKVVDNGTTGTLWLWNQNVAFITNGETITDGAGGSATASSAMSLLATDIYQIGIGSVTGTFTVGETITASNGASAKVEYVKASQLWVSTISSGPFRYGDTITGGTSGATATATTANLFMEEDGYLQGITIRNISFDGGLRAGRGISLMCTQGAIINTCTITRCTEHLLYLSPRHDGAPGCHHNFVSNLWLSAATSSNCITLFMADKSVTPNRGGCAFNYFQHIKGVHLDGDFIHHYGGDDNTFIGVHGARGTGGSGKTLRVGGGTSSTKRAASGNMYLNMHGTGDGLGSSGGEYLFEGGDVDGNILRSSVANYLSCSGIDGMPVIEIGPNASVQYDVIGSYNKTSDQPVALKGNTTFTNGPYDDGVEVKIEGYGATNPKFITEYSKDTYKVANVTVGFASGDVFHEDLHKALVDINTDTQGLMAQWKYDFHATPSASSYPVRVGLYTSKQGATTVSRAFEVDSTKMTLDRLPVVPSVVFASIPAGMPTGTIVHISNARKAGEGAGAGTGLIAWRDGSTWKTLHDNTAVTV